MRMATEPQGTALAVFLVPVEKVLDIAGDRPVPDLLGVIMDIAQNVGSIRLARNEPRAGEKVPVRGTGDNALGHLAA